MARGSIEKRGERSWRLRIDLGYHADGRRNRPSKTITIEDDALLRTNKRLREYLDNELARFKLEVLSNEYIRPEKMTLDHFIHQEWVPKYASDPDNLSPTTLEAYLTQIKNYISPVFGHKYIGDITTMDLVTFIHNISQPGIRKDGKPGPLANSSIHFIYRVFRNILSRAVDWKLIKDNPMNGVPKPKIAQIEFNYYDADEALKVVEALFKEERKWRLFILGALIGGFRRGEIVALQWPAVHFDTLQLEVRENIPLTKKGKAVVKKPKSKTSIRYVDMPEWYMSELELHYKEWQKQKWAVADKWVGEETQYVFHGGYGKPYFHSYPSRWWKRFVRRHNLKEVRFHDLRHSAATILFEAEVSSKAIQKRLGHANRRTTDDIYVHVTRKLSRRVAETYDILNPNRPQSVPNDTKEQK